ncbi:hypothetical protein K523DRAFT_323425 [Schizophyllum commune Tattone D]|nr:hypothetical protein K523DRAFT_323425 [Schizophyllum commune Tattone D]
MRYGNHPWRLSIRGLILRTVRPAAVGAQPCAPPSYGSSRRCLASKAKFRLHVDVY